MYGGYQAEKPSKETNKILIVSNLPKNITPDELFKVFSLYGNVQKIKILYKKWNTALIEMEDYLQAN